MEKKILLVGRDSDSANYVRHPQGEVDHLERIAKDIDPALTVEKLITKDPSFRHIREGEYSDDYNAALERAYFDEIVQSNAGLYDAIASTDFSGSFDNSDLWSSHRMIYFHSKDIPSVASKVSDEIFELRRLLSEYESARKDLYVSVTRTITQELTPAYLAVRFGEICCKEDYDGDAAPDCSWFDDNDFNRLLKVMFQSALK